MHNLSILFLVVCLSAQLSARTTQWQETVFIGLKSFNVVEDEIKCDTDSPCDLLVRVYICYGQTLTPSSGKCDDLGVKALPENTDTKVWDHCVLNPRALLPEDNCLVWEHHVGETKRVFFERKDYRVFATVQDEDNGLRGGGENEDLLIEQPLRRFKPIDKVTEFRYSGDCDKDVTGGHDAKICKSIQLNFLARIPKLSLRFTDDEKDSGEITAAEIEDMAAKMAGVETYPTKKQDMSPAEIEQVAGKMVGVDILPSRKPDQRPAKKPSKRELSDENLDIDGDDDDWLNLGLDDDDEDSD